MAKRTDANQAEIVAALRGVGATVTDTHEVGKGFVDLVVGYRGTTYLVEIKDRDGYFTDDERRWWDTWRGTKPYVVRTVAGALALLGVVEA